MPGRVAHHEGQAQGAGLAWVWERVLIQEPGAAGGRLMDRALGPLGGQAQRAHIRLLAPKLSRKPITDRGTQRTRMAITGESLIKEDRLFTTTLTKTRCWCIC